jgi:hypothetical protein
MSNDDQKKSAPPPKKPPQKDTLTIPGQRHAGGKGHQKAPMAPIKKVGRRRP